MSLPWLLSFCVGFLSLSVEILWVRVISFKFHTMPHSFSFVLAMYLVGIAIGAYIGKLCCKHERYLWLIAAGVLLLSGWLDIQTPRFAASLLAGGFDNDGLLSAGLAIIATAAIKSVLFPIAHHLGSNAAGAVVGRSVSRIYSGNIAGSTLGPLLTGFVLLDRFSVDECFMMIGTAALALAAIAALLGDRSRLRVVPAALALIMLFWLQPWHAPDLMAALSDKWWNNRRAPVKYLIQNKQGVVSTSPDPDYGDVVFGGNVYDGRINVDLEKNLNGLERPYLLAASHPAPRRVLVVGMSTGAWTRVITGFPHVERIDIVEINPGYLQLVAKYPEVAPILSDPRVHIHIDDGRRWLRRHPDEKFDLIVQNTTYHWRANATNLLSREYFAEVRSHMQPGAIATFNTTGSLDVLRTAQAVFPAVFKFRWFVYVSDRDFRAPADVVFARLRECRLDGQPAFQPHQFAPGGVADLIANGGLVDPVSKWLPAGSGAEIITDQNLLNEYRHGLKIRLEPFSNLWPPNPHGATYVEPP
jgi:predicted membrane-bound spermidine synthase